ncbi:histidine kinase [Luteimonas aquatica]|uniref:histidine kinase n=1 Tax=Luteimonas aquatica TaxID=450364 RepID=UPI001F560F02|nr:histidine kinase [Luteimonas aquatica]
MTALLLIVRLFLAWLVLCILLVLFLSLFSNHDFGWLFGLLLLSFTVLILPSAYSHVRRVRLIAGRIDRATLGNRHQRQIEVPFEANEAFALLDAVLREQPRVEGIESTRDSLLIRAKVRRPEPYGDGLLERIDRSGLLTWFGNRRNQVTGTVTPGTGASSSIVLLCEPDSPAWMDAIAVDHGSNLETAEALVRAVTRRVNEHRRNEQAAVQQTATEKELTVARLNLLHAQVEPHFLYNTLASAQLLTRSDPARADLMLGHLISYLRHSLPRAEQNFSTLGEELERANAYLEILKIRMGSRLTTRIDVAPALHGVPFPPMMLQTLVENAIKHGLEPKPEGGTVWVIAKAGDRDVSVTVADDGRGLHAESSGTGIGLKNVRERLRLLYGPSAALTLANNFPAGVAATIAVPKTEGASHA